MSICKELEGRLKQRGYSVVPDVTLWWLCKQGRKLTTFDAGSYFAALEIALELTDGDK